MIVHAALGKFTDRVHRLSGRVASSLWLGLFGLGPTRPLFGSVFPVLCASGSASVGLGLVFLRVASGSASAGSASCAFGSASIGLGSCVRLLWLGLGWLGLCFLAAGSFRLAALLLLARLIGLSGSLIGLSGFLLAWLLIGLSGLLIGLSGFLMCGPL